MRLHPAFLAFLIAGCGTYYDQGSRFGLGDHNGYVQYRCLDGAFSYHCDSLTLRPVHNLSGFPQ